MMGDGIGVQRDLVVVYREDLSVFESQKNGAETISIREGEARKRPLHNN
jgi:hypothetical protein